MQTNYFFNKLRMLLCFVILMIVLNKTKAQQSTLYYIDSIKKVLPHLKSANRVDALNHLGRSYQIINPDTSRWYSNQALAEAKKINYTKGIAFAHMYLSRVENAIGGDNSVKEPNLVQAISLLEKLKDEENLRNEYGELAATYFSQNKFQLAIEYFKKSIALKEKLREKESGMTWLFQRISYAYQEIGNYKEAFEYRLKCFELRKKINDPYGIIESLLEMGNLYKEAGDLETANDYYHQVINYAGSGVFKDGTPRWIIGKAYSSLGNYDSALYHFDKMVQGIESSSYNNAMKESNKRFMKSYIAELYLGKGQYDKSIEYSNEPLVFFKKNRNLHDALRVLLIMGNAYLGKKNYHDAIEQSKEAFLLAKATISQKSIKEASKILWKAYHQLNNTDSAFQYLQQYLLTKESIDVNRSARELAFFKATQEDEEKKARMELLSKENKIKEQQLVIQRQNLRREALIRKYLIAGLLGLFVLGAIVIRSIQLKRKLEGAKRLSAEKELQLQKAEDEKRITELEMMALRSQMNPHFIFNCLNSINRFVLRNDNEAASNYLTKFSKLMRMVLENSKQSLIPLEEEVKCLELYIQMEQFRCKNAFSYYIKYQDGINRDEAMVPPLLLQPFVENAIWHGINPKGNGGEIGIEFFQKNEALYCIINDNGIGRKKASELKSQLAENHKSLGLQITKERLSMFDDQQTNGSVEIDDLYDENGSPSGTKVTVRIFSLPTFEQLKPSLNL